MGTALRGHRFTLKGGGFVRIIFVSLLKRIDSKGKNTASHENEFFAFREDLFSEGTGMQVSKQEVTKVVSLVKTNGGKICEVYPVPFKWYRKPAYMLRITYLGNYSIRPYYRTDPYKRIVKQFLSLQITYHVLLFIAL